MSGILWLASYPKSGNTWLRAFLANLVLGGEAPLGLEAIRRFGWGDMEAPLYEEVAGRKLGALDDMAIHRLRPRVHRLAVERRGGDTLIAKTHNAVTVVGGVPTVTPEVTAAAIYVIRNPLDVVPSYADHFALTLDQAVDAICAERNVLLGTPESVFQVLGNWSFHVRSWTGAPGLTRHVVRYEDMRLKPRETFGGIAAFLGLGADAARVDRAIRFSSFDELARQESETGFAERSTLARRFFRRGEAGGWRRTLDRRHVATIVGHHRAVMRSFGYVDGRGVPCA